MGSVNVIRSLFVVAALGAGLCAQPPAAEAAQHRLAVLEFRGTTIAAETLQAFTDAVRGAALEGLSTREFLVITRENMLALLNEMGKRDCNEGDCEVETARNIGADYVVSGNVTNIEGVYVVTLKLHECKGGGLLATDMVKATTQVAIFDQLQEHSRDLVRNSLGRARGKEQRIEGDTSFNVSDQRVLVRFESAPAGATVLLDGQVICKETPCAKSVQAGRHDVEMQKEGFETGQVTTELVRGAVVRLNLSLNVATIEVATTPAGLPVFLDGSALNQSQRELEPGTHEVFIEHPCYQRTGERFVLKKGEHRQFTLPGTQRMSAISVTAENARGDEVEAQVLVDGNLVGSTPGTFPVWLCNKEVRVTSSDGSYQSSLALDEKQTVSIKATLRPPIVVQPVGVPVDVPGPPQREDAAPRDRGLKVMGVALASIGVASLGAGLYYTLKAKSAADWMNDNNQFDVAKDQDRQTAVTMQYVGYGLGGLAVTTGLILYLTGASQSQVALVPTLTPSYAGLSLQARIE